MTSDSIKINGHVVIKEINADGEVVSVEEGENVVCVNGANSLSTALGNTSAPTAFNYMIISTDTAAIARAHTAISPVTAASALLTPSVDNTGVTSKVVWTNTFASGGSATIWKFAMATSSAGTSIWNEYLFSAAKDNNTNSLQIIYTASIAP